MLLHPAEVAQEMEESQKLHLRTHGVERHHQVLSRSFVWLIEQPHNSRETTHSRHTQALVEEVCTHIDKAAENWKTKIEEHGIHLIQG
jgi:hypothetical protein